MRWWALAGAALLGACSGRMPIEQVVAFTNTLDLVQAIRPRHAVPGETPAGAESDPELDFTPFTVDCGQGGSMRGDDDDDHRLYRRSFRACRHDGWTVDGDWRRENDWVIADLVVSSSTVGTVSCAMDYTVVGLDPRAVGGFFTAGIGTVCGFDWVEDLFCPRDEPFDTRVCAELYAHAYELPEHP